MSGIAARWRKPVLRGELVTLRPAVAGDAEAMWEMINDPEGRDLTATTTRISRERSDEWYRTRSDQDERLDLAVVENATGEVAGEAVLNEHDADRDAANLRIALRGPGWYGRGLGSEATRLLLDHGIRTMGVAEITLSVLARNPRALRVYDKAGFRVVGTRREDGEDWVEMAVRGSRLAPDYPVVTERLLLRPVEPDRDVAAMHSYRSLEEVCRYVPFEPGPVEALAARLAEPERSRSTIDAEGQVINLVVERRDTGQLVGDVVVFWHSARDGHAEIGYVFHPDHAGRGFATEAARTLLALCFDELGAHRVTAQLDARNPASARVAERLGMRHEATFVENEWFKGEWSTLQVYGVLRREWLRGSGVEAEAEPVQGP